MSRTGRGERKELMTLIRVSLRKNDKEAGKIACTNKKKVQNYAFGRHDYVIA